MSKTCIQAPMLSAEWLGIWGFVAAAVRFVAVICEWEAKSPYMLRNKSDATWSFLGGVYSYHADPLKEDSVLFAHVFQ